MGMSRIPYDLAEKRRFKERAMGDSSKQVSAATEEVRKLISERDRLKAENERLTRELAKSDQAFRRYYEAIITRLQRKLNDIAAAVAGPMLEPAVPYDTVLKVRQILTMSGTDEPNKTNS